MGLLRIICLTALGVACSSTPATTTAPPSQVTPEPSQQPAAPTHDPKVLASAEAEITLFERNVANAGLTGGPHWATPLQQAAALRVMLDGLALDDASRRRLIARVDVAEKAHRAKLPGFVKRSVISGLGGLERLLVESRSSLTKSRQVWDEQRDATRLQNQWAPYLREVDVALVRHGEFLGAERAGYDARYQRVMAELRKVSPPLQALKVRYAKIGVAVAAMCKWQRDANRAKRVTKSMKAERALLLQQLLQLKVTFSWRAECATQRPDYRGLHHAMVRSVKRRRMIKGVAFSKTQGITAKEHDPLSHELFLHHQLPPKPIEVDKPIKIASKVAAIDDVYWTKDGRHFLIVTTDKYANAGHQEICFGHIPMKGNPWARCLRLADLPHQKRIGKRKRYTVKALRVEGRGATVRLSVNFEGHSGHPGHDVNLKSELGRDFNRNSPKQIGTYRVGLGNRLAP